MGLTMAAAGQFLAALKAGDARALTALLDENAGYRQLNLTPVVGRAAIAARLVAADTGKIYRDASWREPVAKDGRILLQGILPKDAPLSSVTLTLQGAGTTIALVQHQTLPGAPPPPTPLKLPPDLKRRIDRALSEFHTVMIVYNDPDDQPVMSLRGSTLRIDPCIPRAWPRYEVDFSYHGTRYEIEVENPLGVSRGIASAELDGAILPEPGASIPLVDDGGTHRVRVILG